MITVSRICHADAWLAPFFKENNNMPAEKKPLEQLFTEHNDYRKMCNKNYIHIKSGQSYQLLQTAHDIETQEIMGVYCLNAMPRLKFVRPMTEFVEKFEEGHSAR